MRSQLNRQRAFYALLTCVIGILVLSLTDLHPLALMLAKSTGGPIDERNVPEFTPLSQGAVQLGSLEPERGAYIEISATFHRGDASTYSNLFQTGPGNAGARLEVRGTVATLMVHDYRAPGQLRIVIITRRLDESEHHLEFKALNGQFVSGRIDDDAFFVSKPVFDVSNLLLGAAFDGQRPWDGRITDATIRTGHLSSATYRITMALKPIGLIAASLLALLASVLLFELKKFVLASARRLLAGRTLFGGPWQRPSRLVPNHSAKAMLALGGGGLGFLLALATTAFYHALYFNRYAPVTEGWFLGFAHLMDDGLVPYRDFTLMLPPLYTVSTWALHHLIGDNLLQLRLIGVGVVVLLFLLLQDILTFFFARWAASFASAVAIIYYQSGVAFIGYDFTQFLTLYLLTGLWALERYWLNRRTSARAVCYLFVSGAAFSLAILTKHSNAAVVLMIMGLAFTLAAWCANPFRVALRQLLTFSLGVATPLAVTAITLACFGALDPFFRNTGSDALAAKGGLNLVLSGWISSFFDQRYFVTSAALAAALILMMALIVALAIGTDVVKSMWNSHALWDQTPKPEMRAPAKYRKASMEARWPGRAMSAAGLLLFCLLLLAVRFTPRPALQPWIETGDSLRGLVPAASVSIYLLGAAASGCILLFAKRPPAAPWFFLFVFGLALAAGNGTSSNSLSEISLFVGLAILVATLLTFGSSSMAGQIPTLLLTICLCLSLARDKFAMPYGWWYLKTAPVEKTDCTPAPPLLNGLCFGPGELEKIASIVAQIRAHSTDGESIYVYPHMPMFTLLSDRRPYANAVMSWYDFMVDRDASRIAADLMSSPPPVVVLAKLPQAVIREHEKYFRGGKRSGPGSDRRPGCFRPAKESTRHRGSG